MRIFLILRVVYFEWGDEEPGMGTTSIICKIHKLEHIKRNEGRRASVLN